MDNIDYFHRHLDALRCQMQAQIHAVEGLQKAFTEQEEHLRRRAQAKCLDDLLKKVEGKIEYTEYRENAASSDFTNFKIKMGLLSFVAVNVAGLVFRLKEHPIKMGARLAYNQLANTESFGTVMVGIGAGGVPDDVHVFPIARYSREQGVSESEVTAELQTKGYRLFTREAFRDFLSSLKNEILQGTSMLPAAKASTPTKFVPRGDASPRLLQNGDIGSSFIHR